MRSEEKRRELSLLDLIPSNAFLTPMLSFVTVVVTLLQSLWALRIRINSVFEKQFTTRCTVATLYESNVLVDRSLVNSLQKKVKCAFCSVVRAMPLQISVTPTKSFFLNNSFFSNRIKYIVESRIYTIKNYNFMSSELAKRKTILRFGLMYFVLNPISVYSIYGNGLVNCFDASEIVPVANRQD